MKKFDAVIDAIVEAPEGKNHQKVKSIGILLISRNIRPRLTAIQLIFDIAFLKSYSNLECHT